MVCKSRPCRGKGKSPRHSFYIYIIPLGLLLASLALSGCESAVSVAVGPEVLTVCPSDCDYNSIQEAIEMAGSGDIVEVRAGVYHENVIIDKTLTLLGEGSGQTIVYGVEGPTMLVLSGWVHIEGFTITGGKDSEEGQGDGDGISAESFAVVTIRNNEIKCNEDDGVEVKNHAEVTMEDNEISLNGWGLFLRDYAKATVQGNSIKFNQGSGIPLEDSAEADISDSTISFNWVNGISMWDSAKGTISDSTISGNGTNGIRVREGSSVTAEENWIAYNNGDGILLSDWATAEIRYNTITNNEGWGVAAYERPCHPTDEFFYGTVSGWGNEIPGWYSWEEDRNEKGDVCPESLRWEL